MWRTSACELWKSNWISQWNYNVSFVSFRFRRTSVVLFVRAMNHARIYYGVPVHRSQFVRVSNWLVVYRPVDSILFHARIVYTVQRWGDIIFCECRTSYSMTGTHAATACIILNSKLWMRRQLHSIIHRSRLERCSQISFDDDLIWCHTFRTTIDNKLIGSFHMTAHTIDTDAPILLLARCVVAVPMRIANTPYRSYRA